MKNSTLAIFLNVFVLTLIFSCQSINSGAEYFTDEDGMEIEIVDSLPTSKHNSYNDDNRIYIPGREYIYSCSFFNTDNEEYKISREGYSLTPVDKLTTKTITKISVTAQEEATFIEYFPDYKQTELFYKYYLIGDSLSYPIEFSGVVENAKNIWMHPWRRPRYFHYLQINPYPYIKMPCKVGRKWNWSFKVGDQWSDKEWAIWKGTVDISHSYEILGQIKVDTGFLGILDCHVVFAKGESSLGTSSLTSYFNETYGFVKLDYVNIDSSRFTMNLIAVEDAK
ncbi:hypothetical protein [Lewinella cohaerens]|uniref:hypothetical protein n=1 Tax=Lewinella cohaerens TaxID=70995 RepID=UPI00035D09F3|nr:hypothetical protein [Lewinella cohaerens]